MYLSLLKTRQEGVAMFAPTIFNLLRLPLSISVFTTGLGKRATPSPNWLGFFCSSKPMTSTSIRVGWPRSSNLLFI